MPVPQPVNLASFSVESHKSKRTDPVLLIFMEKRCTTEPSSIRKPAANLLPRPRQESMCTTAPAFINKFSSTHQVPSCNLSPRYLFSASRKFCWANSLFLYSLRLILPVLNMKLSLGLLSIWLAIALGQTYPECTKELARTDECADVINANACYNQNRFNNAQTLQCIDGKDNTERIKKV